MTARHVPLGSMYRWISGALRLLWAHPAALFGASALMLIFYAVMVALNVVVMPPLVTGWMRLLDKLSTGQGGGAMELLAPFRDGAAWKRGIGYTLLFGLVSLLVLALFVAALWTPVMTMMAQVAASQAAIAAGVEAPRVGFPTALLLAYPLFLLAIGFLQTAYFVGFAELALRTATPVSAALGGGLSGVGRNAWGLIVYIVSLLIGGLLLMLVVGLVLGLMMAALMMVSPVLMTVAVFALYVPLLLLMYPLMNAWAYLAWRDMLGDDVEREVGGAEPLAA
jgi:hypothetical protein